MLTPLNVLVAQYNMAYLLRSRVENTYKNINSAFGKTLNNYERALQKADHIFKTPSITLPLFKNLEKLLEDNFAEAKAFSTLLGDQMKLLKALNINVMDLKRQIDECNLSSLEAAPKILLAPVIDSVVLKISSDISSPGNKDDSELAAFVWM
jgi:hypothetical protein